MRAVVKIGTSSITNDHGAIAAGAVLKLTAEIAQAKTAGDEVIVVSSGAVAAGVAALGFATRPSDMLTLQAVSAVGQTRFMRVYNDALAEHGLVGAQVLFDPHDFFNRSQYLHARQTLERLLELGCVPIVNENDAIANDELRYGDNDRIAALVAHLLDVDVLVLLTDAEGLYTADPRSDPTATLIEQVAADDPLLAIDTSGRGTARGSGGMASKLTAARIASWSGVRTVIAKADRPDVVRGALSNDAVGTTFAGHDRRLSARRLWIAFAAEVRGAVVVDDGAVEALTCRNTSLLPAGVGEVRGEFDAGDAVEVCDLAGRVFARGMARQSADALRAVLGRRTDQLPAGMTDEVIHRDDLVLLPT